MAAKELDSRTRQAAFSMLLVDVFTDGLADWYSRHTGLRKSLLLMFAGLGTLWLAASVPQASFRSRLGEVCAILLNEQCMRGWTSFWTVCNEGTDEYKEFNISLGRGLSNDQISLGLGSPLLSGMSQVTPTYWIQQRISVPPTRLG